MNYHIRIQFNSNYTSYLDTALVIILELLRDDQELDSIGKYVGFIKISRSRAKDPSVIIFDGPKGLIDKTMFAKSLAMLLRCIGI